VTWNVVETAAPLSRQTSNLQLEASVMMKPQHSRWPVTGRRAAGLSAAATVAFQVAVLAIVPAAARLAVSVVMLAVWTAAPWLVVLTVTRRRRRDGAQCAPAITGTARAPSPQP
jgi:Flp pilus assembly protein TadB